MLTVERFLALEPAVQKRDESIQRMLEFFSLPVPGARSPRGGAGGGRYIPPRGGFSRFPAPVVEVRRPVKPELSELDQAIHDLRAKLNKTGKSTMESCTVFVQELQARFAYNQKIQETIADGIFGQILLSTMMSACFAEMIRKVNNPALNLEIQERSKLFLDKFRVPLMDVDPNVDMDGYCALVKEKKRRQFFAHWIMNLEKQKILTADSVRYVNDELMRMLEEDIPKTSKNDDEKLRVIEYVNCMRELRPAIQGARDRPYRDAFYARMRVLMQTPGIPGQVKFTILNYVENT